MWKQVKSPNLNTKGQIDWCLAYIQSAFGTAHTSPSAWSEWNNVVRKKHSGTPPKGVYVPIWFSGAGGYGHVAIYKDGKVYSSPWKAGTTSAVLNSIAETERIYGVKYVGWSEDLAGSTIIKEVTVAKLTAAQITKAYQDLLGRKPDAGGLKHYLASGFNDAQLRADIKKSAEYAKRQARLKAEAVAKAKAEAAKKAAEAAEKARLEAEAKKKAEEEAKKAQIKDWGEENNGLLKQILALLKSVFNR